MYSITFALPQNMSAQQAADILCAFVEKKSVEEIVAERNARHGTLIDVSVYPKQFPDSCGNIGWDIKDNDFLFFVAQRSDTSEPLQGTLRCRYAFQKARLGEMRRQLLSISKTHG